MSRGIIDRLSLPRVRSFSAPHKAGAKNGKGPERARDMGRDMDFRIFGRRPGCLGAAALLALLAAGPAIGQTAPAKTAPAKTAPDKPTPAKSGKEVVRSPYASYLAGRVAQGGGDWTSAAGHMAVALAHDPENLPLLRRTFLLYLGKGDTAAAAALAARLKAKGADSFLAAALLVADDIAAGRAADAAARLSDLPKDGLGQYVTPLLTAWARVAAGDRAGALTALEALDGGTGFKALRHLQAALIHDMGGDTPEAAAEYALALEGNRPLRLVQLVADFHRRKGDLEGARALYRDYLADFPDNLFAARELALLDKAGTTPRPGGAPLVTTPAQGLAEALFDVAAALQGEGAGDMALLYGRIALHLRPDQPLVRLLVGEALMGRDRHAEALETFRAITGDPAVTWTPRLRAADALRRLGRGEEAMALLGAMAAERPERTDALVRLGDLHRMAGRDADAIAAYDAALARVDQPGRQHWVLHYARAMALDGAQRWPEAEAALKTALALNPDNPHVLNYLGYSWVDRGERLEEGRDLIARALEQKPDDGHIVDSMGWAAFKLGDFETAIRHLERAVELRPLDPTINDHLGDAYWAVGRRIEARFQWQRAAQQAEDDRLRDAVTRKLTDGIVLPKTASSTNANGAPAGAATGATDIAR